MADQRLIILWVNAVLITLTLCAVVSRAGRKIFVVGKFGGHDGLIVLAAVSATVFSVFQMVSTGLGLGLHQVDVNPANMPELRKLLLTSNVFYFLCNWAIKHALLLFYSEITRERTHRILIYILHGVAFSFGFSSILVDLLRCRPFNKAFYPEIKGYCFNMDAFYLYNSSMMLATDVALYAMPMVFTRNLMLRRAQKVGLNCLFALGGLVLAASAARVWAIYMGAVRPDFTFRFAAIMLFSVTENHIAILVACAPSIKIVALLIFPKITSSLGKLASRITPPTPSFPSWSTRSRSRTPIPLVAVDLESGTSQSQPHSPNESLARKTSVISKGDDAGEVRIAPGQPEEMYSRDGERRPSRASRGFARWWERHERRGQGKGDNAEDMGLVYVEHSFSVEREARRSER
ncbi:hypothetical protein P171DRAFT_523644 [Karstenula rhodostoma CBS 690.94]|uniref:Rhodopsin domain-containing protein n=1 Tax=Karstenula rhodostoma CBS 690.94 TaxID=1392251 RepID=A0A9P4PCW7_9PLEO|nr:hypothetical protein P171DRAFT_523644 [Karstenula rhodostoma CBS 690.94]